MTKLEIIGVPVADGSAKWALYQMMQGKKVVCINGTVYWQDKDDGDLIKYTDGYGQIWVQTPTLFLKCVGVSGWQIHEPEPKESPVDPKERPLRSLILRAKEQGMNIRTWYQDLIFTPESLTSYLSKGRFRWWNIGDWELTKRDANMPTPEPEYVVPVSKITRKLSPSEVIVDIGCLSGTVMRSSSSHFCLCNGGNWTMIAFAMLDAPTRELVERLLAQEEK